MVAQSIRAAAWLNGCGLIPSRLAALRCPSSSTDAARRAGVLPCRFEVKRGEPLSRRERGRGEGSAV